MMFTKKPRDIVMKALRIPETNTPPQFVTWRAGLFLGISIPILAYIIYNGF